MPRGRSRGAPCPSAVSVGQSPSGVQSPVASSRGALRRRQARAWYAQVASEWACVGSREWTGARGELMSRAILADDSTRPGLSDRRNHVIGSGFFQEATGLLVRFEKGLDPRAERGIARTGLVQIQRPRPRIVKFESGQEQLAFAHGRGPFLERRSSDGQITRGDG